jgi:hypothetical protein
MTVEVGNAFVERNRSGLSPALMERAARGFQNFAGIWFDVATSDGYRWHTMAAFNTGNGRVVLAVPHANDGRYSQNTPLDRSPAAYTQGMASSQEANAIAALFAAAMRAASSPR